MIISVSRRTDIPALYADWFMNRIRAGFCTVPNPYRKDRASTISLMPSDVDAIIFWTRNPSPLLPYLAELNERKLDRYIFLFTLLDYPKLLEPCLPPLKNRMAAFLELSERIGPERIIWRYDPILITEATPARFHLKTFSRLAESLKGATQRCIISFMDDYPKARLRLQALSRQGLTPRIPTHPEKNEILAVMTEQAKTHGMTIQTCSQPEGVEEYGIENRPCVDPTLLNRLFNLTVPCHKDAGQRPWCRCAPSRDIGIYDTCTHGCAYCYANSDFSRSAAARRNHDPKATSLAGNTSSASLPLLNLC